ncbi:hypothetical protein HOD38_03340 [archaeon]|nr:hypothetical protein [archaeon]MBT4397274.1 hypothetical protein [archaeon]MBT4440654.1 hypothetical protein [archaeon]
MEEDNIVDEEEVSVEDVAYEAHHKVDALIDLLIKKNIITNSEYDEQIDSLISDMEKEEEKEDCGCSQEEKKEEGCCGCD